MQKLNKGKWIMERKIQTKLLSLVPLKRRQTHKGMRKEKDCHYFLCLSLTSKWVFTQVHTEQRGQTRVKTSRRWRLLYSSVLPVRKRREYFCYCVAVAAMVQYLQPPPPCWEQTGTKQPAVRQRRDARCSSQLFQPPTGKNSSSVSVHTVRNAVCAASWFPAETKSYIGLRQNV